MFFDVECRVVPFNPFARSSAKVDSTLSTSKAQPSCEESPPFPPSPIWTPSLPRAADLCGESLLDTTRKPMIVS